MASNNDKLSPSDALRAKLMERLNVAEDNEAEDAHEISPEDHEAAIQRIRENSEILGDNYDEILPGHDLHITFQAIFRHDTEKLQEAIEYSVEHGNTETEEMMRNGLAELELISMVERMVIEDDEEHIGFMREDIGDPLNPSVDAELEDLSIQLSHKGEERNYTVRHATWDFDPNGIRLSIEYDEPGSKARRTLSARMDFHKRGKAGSKGGRAKEAALDLEGEYLKPALNRVGQDYHHSEFFERKLEDQDDFDAIKAGRLQQFRDTISARRQKTKMKKAA